MAPAEPAAEASGAVPSAPSEPLMPSAEVTHADGADHTTEATQGAATPPARSWSMPKSPVTREHADRAGRMVRKAGAAIGAFIAALARLVTRLIRETIRAIEQIPPTLRILAALTVLMLLGIVGSLAGENGIGLLCTVVVIPVCAITLGALGYRWFGQPGDSEHSAPSESDLQRSVEYIDTKLTLALNAFGTDHHQSAMIALFQAKTAIELTLGTEQTPVESLLSIEDHTARPRIRAGSKTSLRESNSLAAS